jgi:wobble nucleotide-excising tRNase
MSWIRRAPPALQTAIKDTATNRITTKSTEVAETLVTNALRAQFAKEVARIGVATLAIELKQEKSAYGIPRFKVALTRKPDANVGEVLSEGEHRGVALAAFLVELATIDTKYFSFFANDSICCDRCQLKVLRFMPSERSNRRSY